MVTFVSLTRLLSLPVQYVFLSLTLETLSLSHIVHNMSVSQLLLGRVSLVHLILIEHVRASTSLTFSRCGQVPFQPEH